MKIRFNLEGDFVYYICKEEREMKRTALVLVMVMMTFLVYSQERFSSIPAANHWICDHITYYSTGDKTFANAQTPEETLRIRKGNCIDMAILLVYFINRDELYRYDDLYYIGIQKNGTHNHLIVKAGYLYYDPTSGTSEWNIPVGFVEFYRKDAK